jgi:hypothetical protein
LPLDQRLAGSSPAEHDEFLSVIKIGSTSFGGEVKPSDQCRMILQQVKDPYGLKEILLSKMDISHQVSLASLVGVFAGYCRRALVDE